MTIYELHLAFNDLLDNVSSGAYPHFPPEQRDRFLNLGAERFIKQRYGGNNFRRLGVEAAQKRIDDLSNLVLYADLMPLGPGYYAVAGQVATQYYALPDNYWFALNERINGQDSCGAFNVGVVAISHKEINWRLRDPFWRPSRRYRILRVMASGMNVGEPTNLIQVFYDARPQYQVQLGEYELAYISDFVRLRGQFYPDQVAVAGLGFTYQAVDPNLPNFWTQLEYWFNVQCHQEIVDLAVKAALESIEHPRYMSFVQEQSMQE